MVVGIGKCVNKIGQHFLAELAVLGCLACRAVNDQVARVREPDDKKQPDYSALVSPAGASLELLTLIAQVEKLSFRLPLPLASQFSRVVDLRGRHHVLYRRDESWRAARDLRVRGLAPARPPAPRSSDRFFLWRGFVCSLSG